MSVQGDTELSDLVTKTLENSGVLAKIRAELRASVFLVLEEHEAFKGRNLSVTNKPLKDFIATQEGKTIVSLIREFLEFFGLEFTASVFEPEIQADKSYEYSGRDKLAQDLNLNPGKKLPLIAQVLQESQMCLSVKNTSSKESIVDNKNEKTKDEKTAQENSNHISRSEGLMTNASVNGLMKTPDSHPLNVDGKPPFLTNNTSPSLQNLIKKPDRLDLNQMNLKPTGSSMSSLGTLPPLGLSPNNQSNKFTSSKSTKQVSPDIKALLELGSDSPENNYEEDFHQSGSEKASKGTNRSLSGSGSEIEEEMSVGMEDHATDLSSGGSGKSSGADL